ncbi:MAG: ABC transporter permease [Spirochaeta sp.]|jgi:peptide/nickel transport system permease protein|nr:ABC transporter permease [Spirochaeta sp.]
MADTADRERGPEPAAAPQRTRKKQAPVLQALRGNPLAVIGGVGVLFFLVLTLFGPLVAPYPYDQIIRGTDVGQESRRALTSQPPSALFPFGTDQRGRDIFSRMLWGARETLGLPLIATIISVVLGAFLGLLIGYVGGILDDVVSRLLDSLISIPAMVLALVMISTIVPLLSASGNQLIHTIGANNISLTAVIVLIYVPIISRVARSATLSVRNRGYIEEARLRGEGTLHILTRQILPGVLPALVVEAALRLSYAIILVTSLGFLGLGVQPPSPEWGRMVLDARTQIAEAPWELWYPVLGIAVLIVSFNLMSDGIRRVLRKEA